jgi:hypothetical protein
MNVSSIIRALACLAVFGGLFLFCSWAAENAPTVAPAAVADTVRILKENSEATGILKEALQWCVDGKYTQARELVRDLCDENAKLPTEERLPSLLAWHLIASIDAEKTESLEARYEHDKSDKDLKPMLKGLKDAAKAEDSILVLLAFIRLQQNADDACDFLSQLRKQLPENAGFGDGVRQLANASASENQSSSEKKLRQWLSTTGPGAPRKRSITAVAANTSPEGVTPTAALSSIPQVKVEGDGVGMALIVGIGNYDILGPLANCREDAIGVYQTLTTRGYAPGRVVLLTDTAEEPEKKATYTNIKRRIKQVCEFTTPKDSLVIYFAGHGTTIDGEGYLVPQDGDEKDRENSISVAKLQKQMQDCKAGRKLLVLDACHSGSATRGVTGIAPSLKVVGVHVMASCAEKELSHPDQDSNHGIFTRYLLEGMDGKADGNGDGSITQKELFEYVQKKMTDWGLKTGKTQSPQMISPTPDDMIISKVPGP